MSELELAINLEESTNIEVLYQDEVYLDIDSSVVWIESGKTEIDKYVNDVAKPNIDKYVVTVVQPKLDAEVERAKGYADQAQATVDGFDAHAEEAKNNFDQHVATATNDFDVNALTLTARFDNNALAKTNEFNTNAQTMTDGYNQNAMLKIDDFDAHVAVKEMEFDDNASIKQALVDASAKKAKESELNAKTSEDNAKQSELNAKNSENASGISEDNARESERLARLSAESAKTSEDNAKISETNAKKYSENAKVSEDNAKVSETNSSTSETNASTSEQNAGNSATLAQTSERNAKASEEECKRILDSLSNIFVFKGTVPTYNDLPKTGNKAGDVWSTDDTQTYYAWDGTEWDNLGGLIDLSRLVNTDQDQEINASKTFLKDQAIKSPDLDIRNDRSKRGNGLIFTDKNGTQTAGIGVYINNNQSPECRFVASNGTKSAFAGLGVTTDGQGFFEIPEPSDTSDNNDAVSSRWVNKKVNTKQDKLSTAQITATNSGITAAKVATYDGYNATINGKQAQLNAAQLKAVNSGIDNVKVTKYDGYEKTINGKQQALNSTQLNAVNSGITLAKVSTYDGYKSLIDGKADNNSVVHLAGNETITGNKTISNPINLANWNMPRSIGIGNNVTYSDIFNARFGQGIYAQMRVGNKGKLGQISISADDSGNITTHCPTPRDGGGDTQIANISWVNTKLESVGGKDQNTGKPLYDWVGTTAEYEAQNVATSHPDWLCYITDDFTSVEYATKTDLVNKADKDLSNVSANIDYVFEKGITNGVHWERWKSGKLIQWGLYNFSGGNGDKGRQELVKPYNNTEYFISLNNLIKSGGWITVLYANKVTTTGFNIDRDSQSGNGGSGTGYWYTEGQGA